MFDIGPEKLLLIFVAILVFLGPKEIPAAARTLGKWRRRLQSMRETLRAELGCVLDLPTSSSPGADRTLTEPTTVSHQERSDSE